MIKVLIIDDSKFARKSTKELLQKMGYEVIGEAVDGLDGIEKLKELKPDLILSDLEMPNMDGLSMIKKIREFNSDVKIVVVSSLVNSNIIQEVVKYRTSVIKKPIKEVKLVNAIKMLTR